MLDSIHPGDLAGHVKGTAWGRRKACGYDVRNNSAGSHSKYVVSTFYARREKERLNIFLFNERSMRIMQ